MLTVSLCCGKIDLQISIFLLPIRKRLIRRRAWFEQNVSTVQQNCPKSYWQALKGKLGDVFIGPKLAHLNLDYYSLNSHPAILESIQSKISQNKYFLPATQLLEEIFDQIHRSCPLRGSRAIKRFPRWWKTDWSINAEVISVWHPHVLFKCSGISGTTCPNLCVIHLSSQAIDVFMSGCTVFVFLSLMEWVSSLQRGSQLKAEW